MSPIYEPLLFVPKFFDRSTQCLYYIKSLEKVNYYFTCFYTKYVKIRSVKNHRHIFIRNFMSSGPYGEINHFIEKFIKKEKQPVIIRITSLFPSSIYLLYEWKRPF